MSVVSKLCVFLGITVEAQVQFQASPCGIYGLKVALTLKQIFS